jgi:putative ABC transport system permease protein
VAFAAFWSRASLRRRWRSLGGIALLLGLIGGLSLFAIAGARRTQSAYPRLLRSVNPSTMAVDIGGVNVSDSDALMDRIAHFPQVTQSGAYTSFNVAPFVDGRPDLSQEFEALGSVDGRYFDQDVFTPTHGRRPDPSRADEVAVNEESARRYGYHVGQKLDLGTASEDQLQDPDFADNPVPRLQIHSTIVGIGLFLEEVVQDDTDRSPLMLLTPAYVDQAKEWGDYSWMGLVLRGGDADVAAVKAEVVGLFDADSPPVFRVTAIDTFHAEQAVRPAAIALGVFGAIAALATIVLVGQALVRSLRTERDERAVARAMGAGPRSLALASAIGPVIAVVAGTVLAVAIAIAASPRMPIGPMRRVEVDSGIDIDWTVLGLGGLLFIVLLTGITYVAARREAPHRVQRRAQGARPARGIFAHPPANVPLPAVIGLRLAFEAGAGRTAVPVRSVMAGSAVAVTALVAAITFGASLQHLVSHPRQFGWDWDVALVDDSGYGNTNPSATQAVLGNDPDVAAWGGAFFGADAIDGRNLPLLGMEPGSAVVPPIREGRMIERPDEVVLGTATLGDLHKQIGDTVSSTSGPLRIVGSATLPTIGQVHGDHTSLGVGGIVETTRLPGYARNIDSSSASSEGATVTAADYGPNVVFVRFRPGADKAAVIGRLNAAADHLSDGGGLAVTPVQRSAEIVNSDDIGSSPTLLGVAVAVAALAALAVALTGAVRQRRRDLALLKALGFTRRQLSAAVAWQATATMGVGLAVGVPLGVVVGRFLWGRFANQLDVLAEPAIPLGLIAAVILAALVAANVLSALPARYARAVPVSLVLRTE